MRDISHQRVNAVLSEVFAKIKELRLKGGEEEIIISAINGMGIYEREPILFNAIKSEFYRIILQNHKKEG